MKVHQHDEADSLVAHVRNHSCDFYRNHWGAAHSFVSLPTITRAELAATPLSARRYKDGKTLIKVVTGPAGPFFSEWHLDDIAAERFGIPSLRPLVYFTNTYETLEKSHWCYGHGMIRLVGEPNVDATLFMARTFRIDSLVCDEAVLPLLQPFFDQQREPLETISVIGDSFNSATLMAYAPYARVVRLVLGQPETGVFAEALLTESPVFSVFPECVVEENDGRVVLTKLRQLVTPIIRYDTGIPTSTLSIAHCI